MNSRLPSPAAAARSRPNASIAPEMSVQTTRPPGTTPRAAGRRGAPGGAARAAVRPGSPCPAATSSPASPGPIPARWTKARLTACPPSAASSTSTQARQPAAGARHSVRMLTLYWAGSKVVVPALVSPPHMWELVGRTVRRWDGPRHRLDQPSSRAARLWWVLTIWSEEALLEGRGGGRGPGGHAQLGQDVLHVPGHSVLAKVQRT